MAKAVIWLFVIITLVALAWILFYIMGRGFYYNNTKEYKFLDLKEIEITCPQNPDFSFTFIANDEVRVKDLTVKQLRELYTKIVVHNWGNFTQGQNLKTNPFLYSEAVPYSQTVHDFVLGKEGPSPHVELVDDVESMIQSVENTSGGVGLIPAEDVAMTENRGVKTFPIRRVVAAVNPSVIEVVNNRQLTKVSEEEVEEIYAGEYTSWEEVGGVPLEIRPMIVGDDPNPVYAGLPQLIRKHFEIDQFHDRVEMVGGYEEMLTELESAEGAVALAFYNCLEPERFPLLTVTRVESGLNLDWHYLTEKPAWEGKWGGISTIILNTLVLVLLTVLFAAPVGILGSIYLVEYARQGKLIRILRLGTETLAGIPSIIFGLFGFIFFVRILGFGIGFLSGTLSVTMMILPTIIRTSEEALKSVPRGLREGSLALGATKVQTIFRVVLPAASPGILTGIILGVGRTVGETAVLIYTLGQNMELVSSLSSPARVLSLHIWFMFSEAVAAEATDRLFATATVLVIMILIVNLTTTYFMSRLNKLSR
jgi:phosphate transport system permease protein